MRDNAAHPEDDGREREEHRQVALEELRELIAAGWGRGEARRSHRRSTGDGGPDAAPQRADAGIAAMGTTAAPPVVAEVADKRLYARCSEVEQRLGVPVRWRI